MACVGRYDERLNEIIDRYGYGVDEAADSTQIHDNVLDILTRRCSGKKVAIWGVGKGNTVNSHAAVIIDRYALNLQGLDCLVDSSMDIQGTVFMGYPVVSPANIKGRGVDIIIVGSRASAGAIVKNIKQDAPECEYLDIYEELAKRGIKIDYNFFSEQNMYTRLYQLRFEFENAARNDKPEILKEIIASYLKIRDFYYAEKYSEIYVKNKYDGYKDLRAMMDEIGGLKARIAEANSKKKGNVLIHLIDSLRAVDVFDSSSGEVSFKMFSDYGGSAVSFVNAYSTGPTTYESMMGMVKGQLSFEKNVYDGNFMFDFDDFPLLGDMENAGKKIIFYVAKDYLIMEDDPRIEKKEHLHMSEKLWNAACDIAESGEDVFGFLYYPWELHFPLLCGYHRNEPVIKHFSDVGIDDMSGFMPGQFYDCKRYVDLQFRSYKEMLGKDTMNVFLGDHSQPVYDEKHKNYPFFMYYNNPDRSSHIAFFISWTGFEKKTVDGMISMLNFNEIMRSAIIDKNPTAPERDVAVWQYYGIQNKKMREAAAVNGFWDYTEGIQCFLSKERLFAVTATGKEEVYEKKDDEYIPDESAAGRGFAEMIKSSYDISFPKFWTVRQGEV